MTYLNHILTGILALLLVLLILNQARADDDRKAPPGGPAVPEFYSVCIGTGNDYCIRLHRIVAEKYGIRNGGHASYETVAAAKAEEEHFLRMRLR